jgi:hypothetical protein
MPGFLLHLGATVTCSHLAKAEPMTPNPRVTVSGQPTVTIASTYEVAGCTFAPPDGNGPCITAQFVTSALRLTSDGQPLLLLDSKATCMPTETPLEITVTQKRATGV